MPRGIGSLLQAMLDGDSQTLAICALVKKKNNEELGFTTNTSELSIEGISTVFYPHDGIFPTVLEASAGTGIDNMDWSGILSDDRVTIEDIEAGWYDSAFVTLFIVDYTDTDIHEILQTGTIGEITATDTVGVYKVELRARMQQLESAIGEVTALNCHYPEFMGPPCNASTTGRIFDATIATVDPGDDTIFTVTGLSPATGEFNEGIVESLAGANDGLTKEIKTSVKVGSTTTFTLHEPFPFPLVVGGSIRVKIGCDRTWERCIVLNNWKRFGGKPHLPRGKEMEKYGKSGL